MLNFFKKPKTKKTIKVQGMHCASCAAMIESELEEAGFNVKCSYIKQTIEVDKMDNINVNRIRTLIKNLGYTTNLLE